MRSTVALAVVGLLSAMAPATAQAQLTSAVVATGLSNPIAFVMDPSRPLDVLCGRTAGHDPDVQKRDRQSPTFFLDLRSGPFGAAASADCSGWPFRSETRPRRGRFFVNFTDRNGDTVVARFTAGRAGRASIPPPASIWCGLTGGAHRAAVLEPQRRPPRLRSGRLSLHRPWRRRQRRRPVEQRAESRRAARQDAAHRRQRARRAIRAAIEFPRTIRSSTGSRSRRCPRSGPLACAIRGGSASTTGRAAAPARSSSPTSARTRAKR